VGVCVRVCVCVCACVCVLRGRRERGHIGMRRFTHLEDDERAVAPRDVFAVQVHRRAVADVEAV